jgi:hypothetical protein
LAGRGKKSRREKEPSEIIAVDVVKHIALNCFIAVFYVRARMLFLPFFSSEKNKPEYETRGTYFEANTHCF